MCQRLRAACADRVVLDATRAVERRTGRGAQARLELARSFLEAEGGSAPLTLFGHVMLSVHGVKPRTAGHKRWTDYFASHPEVFEVSGAPQSLRVALRLSADASRGGNGNDMGALSLCAPSAPDP